jgi:hypothetical protein
MHATVVIDSEHFEAGVTKLEQLEALLTCTSGLGFENFMTIREELRDLVLLLAVNLAHDALTLLTPQ